MNLDAMILSALSAIAVCTVALIVGYLHRKQMRQIEAFRQSPSVGLVPPETWLWRRFKEYSHLLFLVLPAFPLVNFAISSSVPSRGEVIVAIVSGASIAFALAVEVSARLVMRIINVLLPIILELRRQVGV